MTICCNEPTCLAGGCRHNDLTVLGYFSFLVVINIIIIMIYISEFPNGEKLCCTDDFKGQRRKTLGSRVSLLPGKLLCVRKVIVRPESYCASGKLLRFRKVIARTTEKPGHLSQSCEERPDRLRSVWTV